MSLIEKLEDFDADSLLIELLQRAKEGEIDLTEALWNKMEPDDNQIIRLCSERDIELFDQEEFDKAVHEKGIALLEDSQFFRLAIRIAFTRSKADFIAALNELRFALKKEHNIHHAFLS